ncbi:MAG TPA: 7-carboxy-7-deazaguanine synthase QueE [Ignavibacteria bacterium]|nr:7-carboxy-7-deazaguanine synthase QueE [Ignavibacteria bacterium]
MQISELFYSIQGEGKRSGFPSFFIRTNYCNLRCKFTGGNLCDTSYTSWNPEDKKNLGDVDISFILDEYKKVNCRDVVITGGEPTIYLNELNELCKSLKGINKEVFITIETNGTFTGDFANFVDLVSVSPKLRSSVPFNTEFEKMHEKNRINTDVLRIYNTLRTQKKTDVQWKFVFTSSEDIVEIKKLQSETGFTNDSIFLMPEGISIEDLNKNRLKTIEACLENSFNYTDRIHVLTWGNKRGV